MTERRRPLQFRTVGSAFALVLAIGTHTGCSVTNVGSSDELPEPAFRAVESDPAFALLPAETRVLGEGRTPDCLGEGGGNPRTHRELDSSLPDDAVLDAFQSAAGRSGWDLARRWEDGGTVPTSGISLTKDVGGLEVELVVMTFNDDDGVLVTAYIPCEPPATAD
jgi:hypothetical protein